MVDSEQYASRKHTFWLYSNYISGAKSVVLIHFADLHY